MSILISGILVIASFLLASTLLFGSFLITSVNQADSLKELTDINQERLGSVININGASANDVSAGTNLTLTVGNTGSQSVVAFAKMDVIVQYTDASDNQVLTYLAYNTPGYSDNQWTTPVTGLTPDSFNPGIWDPDETVTIDLRVVPAVKSGTSALVVVSTPRAASDQTSVGN